MSALPIKGANPGTTHGTKGTDYITLSLGDAVEVYGKATANSTSGAKLLRWMPETNSGNGSWYPVTGAFSINAATDGGLFFQRFDLPKEALGDYCLLVPTADNVTITDCFITPVTMRR